MIPAKAANESTIRLLLVDHTQESLTVYTDGFQAYDPLEEDDASEREYVIPGEGEYADGEAHVNTCKSHVSLTRRWLSPHRGISKDKLTQYLIVIQQSTRVFIFLQLTPACRFLPSSSENIYELFLITIRAFQLRPRTIPKQGRDALKHVVRATLQNQYTHTGNAWLGGADPVAFAETFKDRIRHVNWKDLGEDWEDQRGEVYGCGMSPLTLGEGVIDVAGVADVLRDSPDLDYTTLEVAGDENLQASNEFLRAHGAE